jgi:Tfp pilus assembly protein PilF
MNNHNKIRELAGFLRKNPNDSFTKFALALELLKVNEVSKARVLFESVLKQDPQYLGVYYHLGKLYERTGQLADAKEMYSHGIKVAEMQNNERTLAELKEALELLNIEMDYD